MTSPTTPNPSSIVFDHTLCSWCTHSSWFHGDQVAIAPNGASCHAVVGSSHAVVGIRFIAECPCPGFRASHAAGASSPPPATPALAPAQDERFAVAGRCPSCRCESLAAMAGGHVTCRRLECPAPSAADDLLHGGPPDTIAGADPHILEDADAALRDVRAELVRATARFGSFASAHEGWAVIREELDELWEEVKGDKHPGARLRQRHEATQVAAMATRYLIDLPANDEHHDTEETHR